MEAFVNTTPIFTNSYPARSRSHLYQTWVWSRIFHWQTVPEMASPQGQTSEMLGGTQGNGGGHEANATDNSGTDVPMLDAVDNDDTDVPMSDADSRDITDEHSGITDDNSSHVTSESDSIGVATPDSISCITISDDDNGDSSESDTDTGIDENVGDDTPQDESYPASDGNPAEPDSRHAEEDPASAPYPNSGPGPAMIQDTATTNTGDLESGTAVASRRGTQVSRMIDSRRSQSREDPCVCVITLAVLLAWGAILAAFCFSMLVAPPPKDHHSRPEDL
ncbi:hypothetical protein F5Y14DRAFT_93225 [Nemania sp. NC0429]|nr:hypothetical protein F5Y14DRAFT_93225 [Nemania sp. NC0429]